MKNYAILLLSFFLLPIYSSAQNFTKEISKAGNDRDDYHNRYTGESTIQYLEFEEFVIRTEGATIQFFDENLVEVDKIQFPEKSENYHYAVTKDESHLYVVQTSQDSYADVISINLFIIDLYDFSEYETIEIRCGEKYTSTKLLVLEGKLFFAFNNAALLIELHKISDDLESSEEIELTPLMNEYTRDGSWLAPTIKDGHLLLTAYLSTGKSSASQTITFDKNFKLISEQTVLFDLSTMQSTFIDADGEETTSKVETNMKEGVESPAYAIEVNGEEIWIKNVITMKGYTTNIETWVSRDEFKFEINLSEHLKKEMKSAGMKKSTGMNMPIIYADPINNSIIVQYWLIVYIQGQPVESFVYFNLNSKFMLRNAYKVKMTRYPIDRLVNQQMMAVMNNITGNKNRSITLEINKNPKKWVGDASQGTENAFDFLFSNDRIKGLCTIIQANHMQYLFIDREDGSTTAYRFSR